MIEKASKYREAGVDLDAGNAASERLKAVVGSARSAASLGRLGAFGGMVRVPTDVASPVLVMSTDGVGSKVLVAIRAGRHDTVGEDLVNHCVNDILVHGARPLAFLDYLGLAKVDPELVETIVEGVARGCRAHDMSLAGGETAELPDLYEAHHYDLAGTIIGVVSEHQAVHGDHVQSGHVLVGYASTGLHTNGYSLARRVLFHDLGLQIDDTIADLGTTLGDALLAIHRSYASSILPVLSDVKGIAHITGGGIPGNLVRALPDGCGAVVDTSAWPLPPLFAYLERAGQIDRDEMFSVFNMGIGLVAIVPPDEVDRVRKASDCETFVIGEVTVGEGVRLE